MNSLVLVSCLVAGSGIFGGRGKDKPPKAPVVSPIDQYIEEANRHATVANQGAKGSIWSPEARFADLSVDLRASRVNDIVTIQVAESASAVTTGASKTERSSSAQASVSALAGVPKATSVLPNLLKTNSDTALNGNGTTSRTTNVTTTLSARVTHVLPNGNLIVEGTRTIVVNSENQVVTVRGVVRPIDIDTGNNVLSAKVAQMDIKINGKGVVADAVRRPNILYRILLGILPF